MEARGAVARVRLVSAMWARISSALHPPSVGGPKAPFAASWKDSYASVNAVVSTGLPPLVLPDNLVVPPRLAARALPGLLVPGFLVLDEGREAGQGRGPHLV